MKRILFIILLLSFSVNAQIFTENFNNGIPNTWTITNNGIGLGQNWNTSPANFGVNNTTAAIIVNETGTASNPIQDWLITSQIDLTSVNNPQLHFFGKTTPVAPNRNSSLKVMVSTTGTNISDFQLIRTFSEAYTGANNPISANADFQEQIINLTGYGNSTVYIAFVMENVGQGKIWLIDDVSIINQCLEVTDIEISNTTLNTATLNWLDPSNSGSYQLELVSGNNQPTGIPTVTTPNTSYTFTDLVEGVTYKVYVKSVCSETNSNWVSSNSFTLQSPGISCENPINITSLPYQNSNNTANFQNTYTGTPGTGCGFQQGEFEPNDYLYGKDVVYAITPTTNMVVNIEMDSDKPYSGFFIYDNCEAIGTNCIGGIATNNTDTKKVEGFNLTAGTTYYIVVSNGSYAGSNTINYTLTIQQVFCPEPNSLNASLLTTNSAVLNWNNDASILTSAWEIVVQEANAGLPLTSGILINQKPYLAQQTFGGNNLLPGTNYEFYVRAACSDGNFSVWAGPFKFSTNCESFTLPFYEGFNSDSTTESCWRVVDVNNDSNVWDLNFIYNAYEGDQVARFQANTFQENATNDDWLISPKFIVNGQYRLKYHYKVGTYENLTQSFEVKMSTTNSEIASFNQVLAPVENYSNNAYVQKTVYLPVTSGEILIAWHVPNDKQADVMIDNVIIESVPQCAEPYDLAVTNSTATTISVDWQQFGNVISWDVIAIPAPGTIDDDLTGITIYNTTTKPFVIPNLNASTGYNIYVRSRCSATETSEWSNVISQITLPINDQCINSVTVPVNLSAECELTVPGTLLGATPSNLGEVCNSYFQMNDVWYNFTAQNESQLIKLIDMNSQFVDVNIVVYSGNCDEGLVFQACSQGIFGGGSSTLLMNDLVPGQQYFFKVYSSDFNTDLSFNVCITTPISYVTVSETDYTVEQLVTDVLVGNSCLVSNITWRTGTNFEQSNGIAYFNKNNSPFQFEDGIVLTTGDVTAVPGPSSENTTTGGTWDGDDDLLVYMQNEGLDVDEYYDASVLEFDFIPTQSDFSFDFIFASNEYGQFQCEFTDAFAFFLTDTSTNNITNLAVVPGSNDPISVTTIRDILHSPPGFEDGSPSCPSANVNYFDKFYDKFYNGLDPYLDPISFKGYTVPLTAQATVVPGNTYHIKMVIANRNDSSFDSAVFLLGRSFDIGQVDLGANLTIETNNAICAGESYTLQTGLNPDLFSIKWYKDNVEITGANSPNLLVEEPGTYKVNATYNESSCALEDEIIVEFYPDFSLDLQQPNDLEYCKDVVNTIDLTTNELIVLDGANSQDFIFYYYNSLADLDNEINQIANPINYDINSGTEIYMRISYINTPCFAVRNFKLVPVEAFKIPEFSDIEVCNFYQLPILPSGITYHSLPNGEGITYKSGEKLAQGNYTIYVLSQSGLCSDEISFDVFVKDCIIPKGISPNGDGLNDTFDLSFYNVQKIRIYNRYGTEVFHYGSGYLNEWHGQDLSGKNLPSGTYFYEIETPFETFTGWVQLVQEK